MFQLHCTANLLSLANPKKQKTFLGKPMYIFSEKEPNFERFENLTVSVAFCSKFATFHDFKKFHVFFGNRIFFSIARKFWKFREFLIF